MYSLELTKEEIDILILQTGHRLDEFEEMQKQAGKKGDINRVLEIENGTKPLKTTLEKLRKTRYKY